MSERRPGELAWGWRDALLCRDAAAFAGLFAPDGVMIDVEYRTDDLSRTRPLRGRAAIEAESRAWFASTPVFDYQIRKVLCDERSAAKLWRYTVPGIAEELVIDGVTWLTCARGEIQQALVYFDSHALLRGLGRV